MRALVIHAVSLLSIGLLSIASPRVAWAQTASVVAPNADAATEGSSANGFPFNIGGFQTSERYQQVYLASQFSALGPTGGLVTQIAFRPDAAFGMAFSSTLPNVQIDLSTTAATPSTLSGTFANNVGVDDITVFGPGPLTLSSSFTGPAGGPKNFDIIITLTTPFYYNPALGNLLLDVRVASFGSAVTTTFFDFDPSSGSVVGRAFTGNSGVNSPTADTVDNTGGLVTQFTFAVPEPASCTLVAIAVAGALGAYWLRGRRAN